MNMIIDINPQIITLLEDKLIKPKNGLKPIYDRLKKLEEKVEGFSITSLSENELFISTIMEASQIAVRTHKNEKIEVLKNVVLNSALSISIDEEIQTMFMKFRYTGTE